MIRVMVMRMLMVRVTESVMHAQPASATDDCGSHKRTLSSLLATLADDGADVDAIWDAIGQLCAIRTLLAPRALSM